MAERTCTIAGCDHRHDARGFCKHHYRKWRRENPDDATIQKQFRGKPEQSFAARTERQGDCLVWTGHTDRDGYGRIKVNGTDTAAHRFAWEQAHGPIPENTLVDHTCWNHACCEVTHLRLANKSENGWNWNGPRPRRQQPLPRNVSYAPRNGSYQVAVKKGRANHYVGTFPTVEEAGRAAQHARQHLFGAFAGR